MPTRIHAGRRRHPRQREGGGSISAQDVRTALATLGACSWSDIVRHLGPPRGPESRALRRLLDALVHSGEVVLARRRVYHLASAERLHGVVEAGLNGMAVRTDDGRVLQVRPGDLVRAGDRVAVLAQGALASGLRVLDPAPEPLIGVVADAPPGRYVQAIGPDVRGRVRLATSTTARPGAVVEVRLTATEDGGVEGRVARTVEAADEAALAAEALLRAYRIPRTWSFDPSALVFPEAPADAHPPGALGPRRDLRDVPLVTIDGADARDYDDAVFAASRPRGGWRLLVAIADVAHYVPAGSAVDADARERGNSLYLPDRVVPMLPEALSNGVCSLLPERDRLVVFCELGVSAQGRVTSRQFGEGVIRSRARLTYDAVDGFLHGGALDVEPAVAGSLRALHAVSQAFRARREERGALDLESTESRVVLREGRPVGVRPLAQNDAQRLIEEAMIAANVAAARHLESRAQRERPPGSDSTTRAQPVYRVHEPPVADKLETLDAALRLAGERLPKGALTPGALAEVCRRARAKSSWPRWIWDAIVLRSLAQARYETRRLGHFGLALATYAHFTSPIRRYADLLVHRMIKGAHLAADDVDAAAAHVSMTERRAEAVERGVDGWLKCALAEQRIGEACDGTVAAVAPFGLFVELDGLGTQGLVHVSRLGRDYYGYMASTMSLVAERSGERFTLGERVRVVVEEVSVATGRIDLSLCGREGRRRRRMRRAG